MRTPFFVLCISALLPACFLSSWPDSAECGALPVCDAGYSEVAACTTRECTLETLCGQSIYCQQDSCGEVGCFEGESIVPSCDETSDNCTVRSSDCGPVYCQTNLCNLLPRCNEGEELVSSCAGVDDCHSASLCGTTIYCAAACDVAPACDVGQSMYFGACPPDEICEERSACGITVYCGEETICDTAPPCFTASSPVVQEGEGFCPPVLPGPDPRDNCYTRDVCGAIYYCVVVCDLNHYAVEDPSECEEGGPCYSGIGEGREVWCTGEGVVCDAEPFCEEEEVRMFVGEVCPDDWRCRIREQCDIAIQCGQPPREEI